MSYLIRSLHIHRVDMLLMAAMLLSYPVSNALPSSWGGENGPIENAQVAVLLLGCMAAFLAWHRQRGLPPATLALSTVPVWLILAARELSWGATVTQADAIRAGRPLEEVWYQPAVAPAICAGLACSLVLVWRRHLGKFLFQIVSRGHFALVPLLLAMVASYFSACAEGHAVCGVQAAPHHAEVWEEMLELLAYAALVIAQQLVLQACQTYVVSDDAPVPEGEAVGTTKGS